MQSKSSQHCLPYHECLLRGPKPDLEVAQAALPVGIKHPLQALPDNLNKSFQVEAKERVRRPPNLADPEEQRS